MDTRRARTSARRVGITLLCAVTAASVAVVSGVSPPADAGTPGIPVVVGFLSPTPAKVCLYHRLKLEYYVVQNLFREDDDIPLAPLVPAAPVQIALTASHGTMFPTSEPVGPFRAYGQRIERTATYKATSVGAETITITGTTADGTWSNQMSFSVVACRAKLRGSADMTPVTSVANATGGGMWTMTASLEVDGEARIDESGVSGTGSVDFFMTEQFGGPATQAMSCTLSPPWSGVADLGVTGDAAALDEGQFVLTLDVGAIPLAPTRVECSGLGGVSGGFDLPGGDLPAFAIALDPVPLEGGMVVEDLPMGTFVVPLTVSIVEREVAS